MWDDVEMFHIDTFLPLIFSHLCGKMDKIRYRLVYNRQNTLNRQGTALVQVEAYLNQRKIYLKTNVYLKPECWSREGAQVINHPQSNELNAMLYEYILYLQGIELGYWKRGIPATLSLLKDAVKKKSAVNISFSTFAKSAIDNSDKKQSTKDRTCDEGIGKADPISFQHTFFISGTPVLTDEACACSIESKHDVVDQRVCICGSGISGNRDCIEGVDTGLYEQICNGKNPVL